MLYVKSSFRHLQYLYLTKVLQVISWCYESTSARNGTFFYKNPHWIPHPHPLVMK